MKRRAFAGVVGLMALVGVLLAVGTRTATTVWADPSSMDWDMHMEDPPRACPGQPTGNNDNDVIGAGECPDVTSTFWLQPAGGLGGSQSFFDRANVIWTTGPIGADVTGDTVPDPTDGLTANRPATLGASVGQISLEIQSNLLVAALLQNNIDDVSVEADPSVTGQPMRCGGSDTLVLQDTFELWNATTDDSHPVSAAETQSPDPTYPPDCVATGDTRGAACAPKGATMLPMPILALETAIGLPPDSLVSRSYGIAKLPIVAGIQTNMDVNFLVYRLHSMGIDGYLAVTLVQYPGLRSPDPTALGYHPLAQTVQTCPPYQTSATVYGVTTWPDFDEDGWPDMNPSSFTPQLNRLILGEGGPYDYEIYKSTAADYDGDTIPDYADRCRVDHSSGTAAQDTDGDTLTGTCETVGAGNGEGTNPSFGGWNAKPLWDSGQDVDGDTYLNYVDNCPMVADRDLDSDTIIDYQRDSDGDGVGDVCEIDLAAPLGLTANAERIPGDGHGYPGRQVGDMRQIASPGMFVDRDNLCSDPFSTGTTEPLADGGRWCAGFDSVPAGSNLAVLGRVFADSDDDAVPDLLDHPAGGAIEYMDDNSDTDFDGHTDACEAFMGSDPLDASSVPAGPPPAGNCDSEGNPDATDSDPFTGLNPDADGDGCTRSQELPGAGGARPGGTAAGGASFQDQAWYDFFDVPIPANNDPTPNGTRNRAVNLQDVVGVLKYVGTALNGASNGKVDYDSDKNGDTVPDGVDYDRSPSPAPNPPKDAGPPSGAVNLQDVVAVLGQVGLNCT